MMLSKRLRAFARTSHFIAANGHRGCYEGAYCPTSRCSGEKEIAMHIRLHSLGTVAGVLAAVALGGCASSVDSSDEEVGAGASAAVGEQAFHGAPHPGHFMKREARPSGGR